MRSKTRIYEMHYLNLYIGTGTLQQLADLAGMSRDYIRLRMEGLVYDADNYMFYDVTEKIKYGAYRGDKMFFEGTKKEVLEELNITHKRFVALQSKAIKRVALENAKGEHNKKRLWIEKTPYKQLIPIFKTEVSYV